MSHRGDRQRLAFVSQLPVDATQDEMKQLCAQVGEVVEFKIVYDRETGKSKGCGYCEFRSAAVVQAAVENLDGFEHRGTRLRVQRADSMRHSSSSTQNVYSKDGSKKRRKAPSSKRRSVDEITRVVAGFSTAEKREILSQMKALITQKDGQKGARDILMETPQLAQALLLIQIEFNLVKPEDIRALTHNVSNQSPRRNTQSHSNSQSMSMSQSQAQSANTSPQKMNAQNEPNVHSRGPSERGVERTQSGDGGGGGNVDEETHLKSTMTEQQRVAYERVMRMSDEAIARLPESQQAKIRAIKLRAEHKLQSTKK